jgi:hypothetical protein
VTDVWRLLQPPQWRGQKYPCIARSVSFRHEGARQTIQYRDGDFVEQLGTHDLTFAYTFAMDEDVARGPYKNLFVTGVPQLFADAKNREPGELFDPVHGTFRCVPVVYSEEAEVGKRSGMPVRVEFLHSPDPDEVDPQVADNMSDLQGLIADAGALDEEVARADWAQEPAPEPSQDPLNAISGVGQQGLAQIDKFTAGLEDFAFKMEKIEATADKAENPQNWQIRDTARRHREAAIRLQRRVLESPVTKLKSLTIKTATLVSQVAKEAAMPLEDLMSLNGGLARSPFVKPGTVVIVRQPKAA